MSKNSQEIEARGANVDQAIASGLAQLGLNREDVIVEVVDEGSRGLLGLGSRDAVVTIRSLVAPAAPQETKVPVQKPAAVKAPRPEVEPAPPVQVQETADVKETAVTPPPPEAPIKDAPAVEEDARSEEEQLLAEREKAVDIIQTLLDKMYVQATITTEVSEPDEVTGRRVNIIDVNGEDLGVLIGPRGETLGAIQYLSRLMVGHQLRDRANFVIDVQGYRRRREQALTRLAERMAQKVVTRGRAVGLEPMPPNERRIIHMALREHDQVYTQSVGEGTRRKVRILPK